MTTVSYFTDSATPETAAFMDNLAVELGMKFKVTAPGKVTALRFYKGKANVGTHVGSLWSSSGKLLAKATFVNETEYGWQTAVLRIPVTLAVGTTYTVSYHAPFGRYAYTGNYFKVAKTSGVLKTAVAAGTYKYGYGGFPTQTYSNGNYFVDVVFAPNATVPTPTGPTAPPTPTGPTAPPPPVGQLNCMANPSAYGYPDATNTGVQAGVMLKRVPEALASTTPMVATTAQSPHTTPTEQATLGPATSGTTRAPPSTPEVYDRRRIGLPERDRHEELLSDTRWRKGGRGGGVLRWVRRAALDLHAG
jgi:hypothetical protein